MSTDPLTGLYNRRWLLRFVKQQLTGARRCSHTLSLILSDIDRFKKINDNHGHLVGDDVLGALSALVQETLGDIGWLVRWGGEEFLATLPDFALEVTAEIAERVRAAVEAHDFDEVSRVTCSLGAAEFVPTRDASFDALTERTDAALYEAKRGGRNQVKVADASIAG